MELTVSVNEYCTQVQSAFFTLTIILFSKSFTTMSDKIKSGLNVAISD
jgi:hypothetical protein